jgi:hypothetical protein
MPIENDYLKYLINKYKIKLHRVETEEENLGGFKEYRK